MRSSNNLSYLVKVDARNATHLVHVKYTACPHVNVQQQISVLSGQDRGVIYEQRLCIICEKHEIEDGFHLVLSCPLYNQIRSEFLSNIDTEIATIDTFYNLFNRPEHEVLLLAKYIYIMPLLLEKLG